MDMPALECIHAALSEPEHKTSLKWIRLHSEARRILLSLVRTDMLIGSDYIALSVQQRRLNVSALSRTQACTQTLRRRRISMAAEQRKWRGKAKADG